MPMLNKGPQMQTRAPSTAQEKDMHYRESSIRLSEEGVPSSLDIENRTVQSTMATEAPVPMWDWYKGRVIPEVLLMSGVQIPASRQVPLLDSHSRYSTSSVLGSTREIEVVGNELVGNDKFSEAPEAESPWTKTKEGHLTDRSVGYAYKKEDAVYVDDGQTAVIDGREFIGPVKVVKKWRVKENSVCPIGADENAKARAETPNNSTQTQEKELKKMDEKLRAFLETQGLSPDATEEEAQRFYADFKFKTEKKVDVDKERQEASETAIQQERARGQAIRSRCSVAGMPEDKIDDFINRGLSLEDVSTEIFTYLENNKGPVGSGRTQIEEDAQDKFRSAATDGISLRAGLAIDKPAPGHEDFRGRGLLRIAEECLTVAGVNVRGLRGIEIAAAAMGMNVRGVPSASTSDFPLIMSSVANKRLLKSWEQAAVTWDVFCNVVDASDFKPLQGIDVSALPVLDLLNQNGEYKEVKITETGESYVVKTYGNMFKLSRQMIINDDLRVFLRIPKMFGGAAKRTINNHVFSLLESNPVMADGKALFHLDHKNIVSTGVGAPDVTSLSEGRQLMRQLKDPGGKTNLNLLAKYLVAGSKHETNIDIVLTSAALPEDNKSSGVVNPFKAKLTPVIDATQDIYDEDAWFLFPDKSASDAIEVAFLDGVQVPYLEDMVDFDTDGIKFKCRIDFGAGAMSHRIIKNPGI